MAKEVPAVPAFAPVTDWPKRGRVARERTPEEIALRDALLAALTEHAAGVADPETYADLKAARNAANRYRSLLGPVVPAGKRIESAVDATDGAAPFSVRLRIGDAKPRKAKAPAAEAASA